MTEKVKANDGKNSVSIKKFLSLSGINRNYDLLKVGLLRLQLSNLENRIIKKYFDVIVNTDYFSESSYMYLVEDKSYRKVAQELGKYTETYLGNVTLKESKEFFERLGVDPYVYIIKEWKEEREEEVLNSLDIVLTDMLETTKERVFTDTKKLSDKLTMDLADDLGVQPVRAIGELDKATMGSYVKKLRVLSKPYMEFIVGNLDKEYLNQISYVITTSDVDLTEQERELKSLIRRMWMLDEN